MTGYVILKNFFKLVHNHYNLAIADFDLQVDEDYWQNNDIIDHLSAALRPLPERIDELVNAFRTDKIGEAFLMDEYTPVNNVEILDFTLNDFTKRNRPFSYSDTDFGYMALSKLLRIIPVSAISGTSQEYRTLLDFISTATVKTENAKIEDLLGYIENSDSRKGILVHKIAHNTSSLSIYSYLYYKELLQGNKIELDPNLNYISSHLVTANLIDQIDYQQYFELFDILNEVNHAPDVITRFLKLYHMIEYLIYRKELVLIELKARTNRTFIREIHNLSNQGNKELEILKRNLKKIFENQASAGVFNINPLSADEADFIRNYWSLPIPANNVFNHREISRIAELIYKIRNSIVHNKESEFHITTSNPEDYQVILPLIKRFMGILETEVLKKIALNDGEISYPRANIELY